MFTKKPILVEPPPLEIAEKKAKLHVRIMEAFSHLTHHHQLHIEDQAGSSGSSTMSNFKQPTLHSPQTSISEQSQTPQKTGTEPIAIPSPRKHRSSFWGLFGKRLEREEIQVGSLESSRHQSPSPDHARSHSVIKLDDETLKLIQENVPDVSEPSDVAFSAKYRFVNSKVIGKGASGIVRLACLKDATNGHVLAVKEFRRRKRDESQHEYLRKITAEYCIATSMHHVNVVETVDFVQDREKWYEVMEYCPGGDLFNALSHGGEIDEEHIDSCFKELVEGVCYLHSLGVAHRDLKLENILIDSTGHARITDFGVSDVFKVCWERVPHKSRGVCGSSPYIAPEEFGGEEYDAQKVDVWSLAIIYYALVFHSVPWEEAKPTDPCFAEYLLHGPDGFEPFQRLPKPARSLLKAMLQVDPAKRISIEQVREDPWVKRIPFVPLPIVPSDSTNGSGSG